MSRERLMSLLEYLVRSLVKDKEAVQIQAEETETTLTLALRVAEEDMGRVIGKGGKTAKAIRTLVKAASDRDEKRVSVDILE